ncbi:MAG: STAS domain-containing protein [Rhodocyclaceae bacterium]|nr:STAS domain-containing protein [Rhodocyclaceae bacterium]
MAWDIRTDAAQKTLWIAGELTIFSVLDIRGRLLEALSAADDIEVDLGEVTEIDTAGLQLMLLAKRKAGKTVRFRHHSDEVMRLVDLANVGHLLGDPLLIKAN